MGYGEPQYGFRLTSQYADGEGNYFVVGAASQRTFCTSEQDAKDHASMILRSSKDELLIVKVIGRVRRAPVPVVYERVEYERVPKVQHQRKRTKR